MANPFAISNEAQVRNKTNEYENQVEFLADDLCRKYIEEVASLRKQRSLQDHPESWVPSLDEYATLNGLEEAFESVLQRLRFSLNMRAEASKRIREFALILKETRSDYDKVKVSQKRKALEKATMANATNRKDLEALESLSLSDLEEHFVHLVRSEEAARKEAFCEDLREYFDEHLLEKEADAREEEAKKAYSETLESKSLGQIEILHEGLMERQALEQEESAPLPGCPRDNY